MEKNSIGRRVELPSIKAFPFSSPCSPRSPWFFCSTQDRGYIQVGAVEDRGFADSASSSIEVPPITKLASHPTINVTTDPINTYHCHEIGRWNFTNHCHVISVWNFTNIITAAPATMPMIAGADRTRLVKVPRRKIPRITPLVKD